MKYFNYYNINKLLYFGFRCKKWEVFIEKIYNKIQREKFRWVIDMVEVDFEF